MKIILLLAAASVLSAPAFAEDEPKRPNVERLERVQREVAELRKAGRNDEADKLERNLAEAKEQMQRDPHGQGERREKEQKKEGAKKGDPRESGQGERLAHLKQAIQHLSVAGFHEPAAALTRQLEQMHSEAQQRERGGEGKAPEAAQMGRAIGEMQGAIKQLHEEVMRLRRDLDETRARIKKD